jgi:hypothetical protein
MLFPKRKHNYYCYHYRVPDDGGSELLWNVGEYLQVFTVLHLRRQPSSYLSPWEPHISPIIRHCFPGYFTFTILPAALDWWYQQIAVWSAGSFLHPPWNLRSTVTNDFGLLLALHNTHWAIYWTVAIMLRHFGTSDTSGTTKWRYRNVVNICFTFEKVPFLSQILHEI